MNLKMKNLLLIVLIAIVALLLILLPIYAKQYTVTTFTRIIYFGFLAMSMGFLVGNGGMMSLVQTTFFGLTGYIIGLLGVERGFMFPWPDLISIGAVIIISLFLSLILARTYNLVFLMITLAVGQICWAFATQNTTILHGWAGIRGIRPPVIFGINFNSTANFYWVALIMFVLGLFILWCIVKSPFVLALNGIRENPRRMAALGYPVYWIRVVALVIAALYAGLGGILAAYSTGIITPTTIQLSRTTWILLIVILGGSSYFWGPLIGTFIAVWLDVLISQVTERYNLVIGVIFLLIVLFSPNGILGFVDSIPKVERLKFIKDFFSAKRNALK